MSAYNEDGIDDFAWNRSQSVNDDLLDDRDDFDHSLFDDADKSCAMEGIDLRLIPDSEEAA